MKAQILPIVYRFVALFALMAWLGSVWSGERAMGADGPVIDAISSATTRYEPVVFSSHARHSTDFGITCVRCHHNLATPTSPPDACGRCHDRPGVHVDMADAAHGSCVKCHVEAIKVNPAINAPVQCLECHVERP